MKNIIYIFLLITLTTSCNTDVKTQIISVLEDKTEANFAVVPTPETILSLYHLEDNIWKSVIFRYGSITSLENNHRKQVSLQSEQSLFGNELQRKQDVVNFTAEIASILEESKDTISYKFSAIWLPVVEEIKSLQRVTNATTTLYLYSDLRENTNHWFSTYNRSDVTRLKTDMESVVQLFLDKATGIIPSENISLVVIYTPKNEKEDQSFNQLKKLYQSVFDQLGISISFTTNIT